MDIIFLIDYRTVESSRRIGRISKIVPGTCDGRRIGGTLPPLVSCGEGGKTNLFSENNEGFFIGMWMGRCSKPVSGGSYVFGILGIASKGGDPGIVGTD